MRFAFALSVLVGGAGAAQAACLTTEHTFMSCRIADSEDVLRVCFDGTNIFYRYGPADQPPALALSESVASVAYTPWPGIGRAIWESVSFTNAGYVYEAFAGFDRMLAKDADDGMEVQPFGGVHVIRDGDITATRTCAADAVRFGWDSALFDAKTALGLIWDVSNHTWLATAQQ
ncbi:hypothetical protein [Yoonia sp.]|uniref:hypothetical protein n=1 Tax=Yoonia sp. TaxID=2212373 RepID=UPI003919FEAD